jgi:hypothetical protein
MTSNLAARRFCPAFGVHTHTPAARRELAPGLTGEARKDELRRLRRARHEPCPTCGWLPRVSTIPDWSWAYCPACHAVAPSKAAVAAAHDLGTLKYDRDSCPLHAGRRRGAGQPSLMRWSALAHEMVEGAETSPLSVVPQLSIQWPSVTSAASRAAARSAGSSPVSMPQSIQELFGSP